MQDRSCLVEIEDEGSGMGIRLPLVTDKYKTMKINVSTSFSPLLLAGRRYRVNISVIPKRSVPSDSTLGNSALYNPDPKFTIVDESSQ